jgi:hypothetical protein
VYADTSRIFSGLQLQPRTGNFGIAASGARPLDPNSSRKNEIECCVNRLNPPPIADIARFLRRPTDEAAALTSRVISALGHKQACATQKGMSDLPAKADIEKLM